MIKLVKKQLCWTLTGYGRLVLIVFVLTLLWLSAVSVYPFLAVTQRIPTQIMVMEGWIHPVNIQQAITEYRKDNYNKLIVIYPSIHLDDSFNACCNYGMWVASYIEKLGIPKHQIITLFPHSVHKDRTFHMASTVKRWLEQQGGGKKAIVLVTQGPHARRTMMLYHAALGETYKVGIIALRNLEYDPEHWWRTSAGVREVIGETIAYIYYMLTFFYMGS